VTWQTSPLQDCKSRELGRQILLLQESTALALEKLSDLADGDAKALYRISALEDGNSVDQKQISALQEANANALQRLQDVHEGGKWTHWSTYGECSVTCGTGRKTRHRMCFSPTMAKCIGDDTHTTSCTQIACKGSKFSL